MAANDPCVQFQEANPPGTLFASGNVRVGGSTPAESLTHWEFDDTAAEYMDFKCILRGYDGGGLTFTLCWIAASATTGNVLWGIGIRRLDTGEDVDGAHTYDFNNAAASAAPATNGRPVYPTITFTDGADMDSWAEGEEAIVRVRRLPTDAADDMTGDALLVGLDGRETA